MRLIIRLLVNDFKKRAVVGHLHVSLKLRKSLNMWIDRMIKLCNFYFIFGEELSDSIDLVCIGPENLIKFLLTGQVHFMMIVQSLILMNDLYSTFLGDNFEVFFVVFFEFWLFLRFLFLFLGRIGFDILNIFRMTQAGTQRYRPFGIAGLCVWELHQSRNQAAVYFIDLVGFVLLLLIFIQFFNFRLPKLLK